jgi:iron only hydrogenase large subunit-like protein
MQGTLQEKVDFIKNGRAIAMLAPMFPIDFQYPAIIGMLRHLGFEKVTELTFGARMVNWSYVNYIKEHPDQKHFIATPCPTVVALVSVRHPALKQYLMPVVSPMVATAMMYRKHHPDHRIVFISPCFAKENLEAPMYRQYIDAVITMQELREMFNHAGVREEDFKRNYYFDSFIREFTKIYPVSGGLSSTSHMREIFKEEEILVADGPAQVEKALADMEAGKSKYRFLDLLNCEGGCIGGPAVRNKDLAQDEKVKVVKKYIEASSKHNLNGHEGKVDYAKDVDFSRKF